MHLAFFVDRVNFFNAMQQMIKNNIFNNTNKKKTFIFKFLGYNIIVHLRNIRNTLQIVVRNPALVMLPLSIIKVEIEKKMRN